jgi:thiamine biosynthesis protein ThiC
MVYTTQMDAAKKGIVTKEMTAVALKEKMDVNVSEGASGSGENCHTS